MVFFAHKEYENRPYPCYRLGSHLALVAAECCASVAELPRSRELLPLAAIVGLTHDFAKYTSYFQNYLLTGQKNEYKGHAFLSALWAAFLAERQNLGPKERLVAFTSVLWHHCDLGLVDDYLVSRQELEDQLSLDPNKYRRIEITAKQVEDLSRNSKEIASSLRWAAHHLSRCLFRQRLSTPELGQFLTQNWEELLAEFLFSWKEVYVSLYRDWRKLARQEEYQLSDYFFLVSLFSALIDADKLHSARVRKVKRPDLPSNLVFLYKKKRFAGSSPGAIDILREEVFRNTEDRIKKASLDQRFFTLTAPTGSGKTLAVLNATLILRERLSSAYGRTPRIVYALPFTSVIDQTYHVLWEILQETVTGFSSAPSPYLLKHHHLADVFYRAVEEEDLGFDAAMLLIESWQSEVIITTFVQLLHTLIGYRNRMLKKFNQLNHAIVIMDEVQNIPVEYWPLVTTVLKEAAKELDLRLILMTATRPEWFSQGEAAELAGEPEDVVRFFRTLNRVRLYPDLEPRTVAEAAELFLSLYEPSKSYLVVLNTIRSSIEFYQCIREVLKDRVPLFYLSTNIIPAERERRLEELRRLLERGAKPVLVSTQVVEAGVDLDFDEVWRDIGPIDAVVQVAGRCNRHFRKEKGLVRLVRLVDEKGNTLARRVYGNIHVWGAERVFEHRSCLEEPDFFEAVANFFRFVRERKDTSKSEGILKAMKSLRFQRDKEESDCAVRDFRLIEDRPDQVEVFVAVDEKAESVWQFYRQKVVGAPDIKSRQEAYYKIKRDFGRYIISVPAKLLLGKVDETVKPLYIPSYLVPEIYDWETGFKRVEEGMFIV